MARNDPARLVIDPACPAALSNAGLAARTFHFYSGEIVGERTSAVANYRTAMPQHVPAGGTSEHPAGIDSLPLRHARLETRLELQRMPDPLLDRCLAEGRAKMSNLMVHRPAYHTPVPRVREFLLEASALPVVHVAAALTAADQQVTDQQAARNCLSCLPCNLV